jgi:hypothetical protein
VFNETCHNGTDACPIAEYSASLIGDRAVELIYATPGDAQKRPMFMYLAWQSGAHPSLLTLLHCTVGKSYPRIVGS